MNKNYFSGLLDEGFTYQAINRILNGQVFYKDFYCLVTPGTYYLGAIFELLFGSNILILRSLTAFCIACFSTLAYHMSKRYINNEILSLMCFASINFISFSMGGYLSYIIYAYQANFFGVLSVYYFLNFFYDKQKRKDSILSGTFLTICFLFKQTVCLYYLIAMIIACAFILLVQKDIHKIMIFVKGLLVPCVTGAIFFLAYFGIHGALEDMFRNILLIPLNEFGEATIPPPMINSLLSPSTTYSYMINLMYFIEILILIIIGIFLVIDITNKRIKNKTNQIYTILFIFSMLAFRLNWERYSSTKVISTWPIFMITLAIFIGIKTKFRLKVLYAIIYTPIILFAIIIMTMNVKQLRNSNTYYFPETSLLTDQYTYTKYDILIKEIRSIMNNNPNQDFFIFPMSPILYPLLNIENPTRQDLTILGNFDEQGLNEIVSILSDKKVQYLVFDNYWDMDGQRFQDYANTVYSFIEENYHVIWTDEDKIQIYERN
jgi:hypothetical protein